MAPSPDFGDLSRKLDKAEMNLALAADTIDGVTAADLRGRIARARAELDFLEAMDRSRAVSNIAPLWMQFADRRSRAGNPET